MDRREFNRMIAADRGRGATEAYTFIYISKIEAAIVDMHNFEKLNKHLWQIVKCKNTSYARRKKTVSKGKRIDIYMHQEILKTRCGMMSDHINRNGLDNRECNLREVTNSQNMQNCNPRKGKSIYRGAYQKAKGKKWYSRIRTGKGKRLYLGSFDSEIDAAKAYDDAARKYYGEHAAVNFLL